MARPPTSIDYDLVTKLAMIDAWDAEIAVVIGFSAEGFCKRKQRDPKLIEALEKGRANSKVSLRRAQWQAALGGNPTMLIWLGKQILGQRDRYGIEHTGGGGGPIIVKRAEDLTDDELAAIVAREASRDEPGKG